MRELERDHSTPTPPAPALPETLAILGDGRAGGSIAAAARRAGIEVSVRGREGRIGGATTVLICVPDAAIREACERIVPALRPGSRVGHVSGANGLEALEAADAARHVTFSLHPLQTIPTARTDLAGAPCAVSGSSPAALAFARSFAASLNMRPFEVPEDGRAAYHAAASMASNFLVALEESAARLLDAAGVQNSREVLAPLVLRTAANWVDTGPGALTGPIARGDSGTVARHLDALSEIAPELRPLYEALAERAAEVGRRQ